MMAKQDLIEAKIRKLMCVKETSVIYQDSKAPVTIEKIRKNFGKDADRILAMILGKLEEFPYTAIILNINDPEKRKDNTNSFSYSIKRDWGK